MTVRLFFFLLALANLIFFAWWQGYLGASDDDHEPQRLERQLHAEKLRVVPEVKAPAAKQDNAACHLINGLSLADAEALSPAVVAAGATAKTLPLAEPALYLVAMTDLANKALADRKIGELTRLGITELSSAAREGGRHEVILGRFPTEVAANEFLQTLTRRGVKSARVVAREQPAVKASVEIRGPASTLQPQLPQLLAPFSGATIGECAAAKR